MPKLKFYLPARVDIEVDDPKNKEAVEKAITEQTKHFQSGIRVARLVLRAYKRNKFTVEQKDGQA